jgi:type II secretory pathway component PulJ
MTTQSKSARTAVAATTRPRGFAFTEILFAVMVLALGFIMIAAMFPVTIRQTQSTMEEATGANVAKAAIEYLQTVASDALFPANGNNLAKPAPVNSLTDLPEKKPERAAYLGVRGNFVNPENPRIAWVPLYRRHEGSPFVQVFIIVMQSRNRDQYVVQPDTTGAFPDRNYSDFDVPADAPTGEKYSTLEPRRVAVSLMYDDVNRRGVVQIDPKFKALAASGEYLIIAQDPNKNKPKDEEGQSNGRIYQLGNPIDEAAGDTTTPGTWELSSAADMIRNGKDPKVPQIGDDNDLLPPSSWSSAASDSKATFAYIVGRGYKNPTSWAEGYSGPAQDIAVYTGFIQIPQN